MSVRRISELPSVYDECGNNSLSSSILEVSHAQRDSHVYRSYQIRGNELLDAVLYYIAHGNDKEIYDKLSVEDLYVIGDICAYSPTNYANFVFEHILLSADPVVINNHLTVYRDKTTDDKQVSIENPTNKIKTETVDLDRIQDYDNKKRAVNCELLTDCSVDLYEKCKTYINSVIEDLPTDTWRFTLDDDDETIVTATIYLKDFNYSS